MLRLRSTWHIYTVLHRTDNPSSPTGRRFLPSLREASRSCKNKNTSPIHALSCIRSLARCKLICSRDAKPAVLRHCKRPRSVVRLVSPQPLPRGNDHGLTNQIRRSSAKYAVRTLHSSAATTDVTQVHQTLPWWRGWLVRLASPTLPFPL